MHDRYDKELPRERLISHGAQSLTDEELLSVLLGTGCRGVPVRKLSAQVLGILDSFGLSLRVEELSRLRGIGIAKASTLVAALELSRRRIRPEGTRIRSAADVVPLLHHLRDRKQEHFVVVSLSGAHEVIAVRVVTIGLVNMAHVHPREVFAEPIKDRAAAIIAAHNHPSGELEPSLEDREVTRRLKEAGQILGIKLLDHVIVSTRGHRSIEV